jgi:hypothetical protein
VGLCSSISRISAKYRPISAVAKSDSGPGGEFVFHLDM